MPKTVQYTGINMKLLIFFFAVLTKSVCCAADVNGTNKICSSKLHYDIYLEQKSCLKSYMSNVINASAAPDRRKRDAIPDTTGNLTTSTTALPAAFSTSTRAPTTISKNISESVPILNPDRIPLPTKICSSIDEVKGFFKEKWVNFVNKINQKEANDFNISYEIRKEILDKVIQRKTLKEFKPTDFACIKSTDHKQALMDNCVLEILRTSMNITKIPRKISNGLSKFTKIEVNAAACKNHREVTKCVKGALKNCSSTVQTFVDGLDNIMTNRCNPKVEPKKGLNKRVIVIVVLVCICGSIAAGIGVYKFLKMRRNRGLHTVTRSPPEECEMTSRTQP